MLHAHGIFMARCIVELEGTGVCIAQGRFMIPTNSTLHMTPSWLISRSGSTTGQTIDDDLEECMQGLHNHRLSRVYVPSGLS